MTPTFLRLAAATALASTLLCAQAPGRKKRTVTDAEVQRVHKSALLIDAHNDVTSATVAGMDIGKPNPDHMTDIPRMKTRRHGRAVLRRLRGRKLRRG